MFIICAKEVHFIFLTSIQVLMNMHFYCLTMFISCAKEVNVFFLVCWFVSVSRITLVNFTNFLQVVGLGTGNKLVDFGVDPDLAIFKNLFTS